MDSKSSKLNAHLHFDINFQLKIPLFLILFSITLGSKLNAQRLVERELIINPLFNESLSINNQESKCFSSVYGWGSFGNYLIDDDEHEWYQKLGMLIELLRTGNSLNISFESHIEFIANDRNTLGFNPKAIIWEEGFLYTKRHNNSFLQVGYFHRCKHDIDNYIEKQERAMIYGGLLFKYITPLKKYEYNNWINLSFRSEVYTILQDERLPEKNMEIRPNIEELIGSLSFNLNSNYGISKNIGFYSNIYGTTDFFSHNKGLFNRFKSLHEIEFSGGISLGVALQGDAHFRIGLNYEYLSDNLINITPTSSSLISIGIMIIDPRAML